MFFNFLQVVFGLWGRGNSDRVTSSVMKLTPDPTRQLFARWQLCSAHDCPSISTAASLSIHPSSVNCHLFLIRFTERCWSLAPPPLRQQDDTPNRSLVHHWTHTHRPARGVCSQPCVGMKVTQSWGEHVNSTLGVPTQEQDYR